MALDEIFKEEGVTEVGSEEQFESVAEANSQGGEQQEAASDQRTESSTNIQDQQEANISQASGDDGDGGEGVDVLSLLKDKGFDVSSLDDIKAWKNSAEEVSKFKEEREYLNGILEQANNPFADEQIRKINSLKAANPDVDLSFLHRIAISDFNEMSDVDVLKMKYEKDFPEMAQKYNIEDLIKYDYGAVDLSGLDPDDITDDMKRKNQVAEMRMAKEAKIARKEFEQMSNVEEQGNPLQSIEAYKQQLAEQESAKKEAWAPVFNEVTSNFKKTAVYEPGTSEPIVEFDVEPEFFNENKDRLMASAIEYGLNPQDPKDQQRFMALVDAQYQRKNLHKIIKKAEADAITRYLDGKYKGKNIVGRKDEYDSQPTTQGNSDDEVLNKILSSRRK